MYVFRVDGGNVTFFRISFFTSWWQQYNNKLCCKIYVRWGYKFWRNNLVKLWLLQSGSLVLIFSSLVWSVITSPARKVFFLQTNISKLCPSPTWTDFVLIVFYPTTHPEREREREREREIYWWWYSIYTDL